MPHQLSLSTVLQCGVAQAYGVLGSWLCCRASHRLAACLWAELSSWSRADAQIVSAWNWLKANNRRNDCAALN